MSFLRPVSISLLRYYLCSQRELILLKNISSLSLSTRLGIKVLCKKKLYLHFPKYSILKNKTNSKRISSIRKHNMRIYGSYILNHIFKSINYSLRSEHQRIIYSLSWSLEQCSASHRCSRLTFQWS